MSRPAGVRNQDFDEKRQALVEAIANFALFEGVERPSFRQMAIAAETSEPTLRHYFKDRRGVIVAIFKHLNEITEPMRAITAIPEASLGEAISSHLSRIMEFRKSTRYIRGQEFGIRESMSSEAAREAYLKYLVEPGVDAIAEKLVKTPGGPKNYQTARSAGMMLMSASIMMVLHQELLNGKTYAPVDVDGYFDQLKAWLENGMKNDPDALGN